MRVSFSGEEDRHMVGRMQVWGVVYVCVGDDGKYAMHEDGTPVLYMHPHEGLEFLDASGDVDEYFEVDGLRYNENGGTL